jgi:hypothetical protein
MIVASVSWSIGITLAGREGVMVDPKGSKGTTVVDAIGMEAKNTISVVDWKEIERELKEELAEIQRWKLVCFQKTRNKVIKKAETMVMIDAKVNAQLSPKDLVHMVDVSVASKYVADLTQFTRVVVEDMRSTLDAFKTDMNSSLPRQVRSIVQQIGSEAQGKHVDEFTSAPSMAATANPRNMGTMVNFNQGGGVNNLNFPQPFY